MCTCIWHTPYKCLHKVFFCTTMVLVLCFSSFSEYLFYIYIRFHLLNVSLHLIHEAYTDDCLEAIQFIYLEKQTIQNNSLRSVRALQKRSSDSFARRIKIVLVRASCFMFSTKHSQQNHFSVFHSGFAASRF